MVAAAAAVTPALDLPIRMLRVGYVSALAALDILLLTVLAFDNERRRMMHLSFTLGLHQAYDLGRVQFAFAFAVFFVLVALIVPIALAVVRVYLNVGPSAADTLLGKRHVTLTVVHVLVALVAAWAFALADGFRVLSGFSASAAGIEYAFSPYIGALPRLLTYGAVFVSPLLGILFRAWAEWQRAPDWLREFPKLLSLADLDGALYPHRGRRHMNFDGGLAPEIRIARARAEAVRSAFNAGLGQSRLAWDDLNEMRKRETRGLLTSILHEVSNPEHVGHMLFSGTSRALEAALSAFPGRTQILLSPFEHPTEQTVAAWHASRTQSPKPKELEVQNLWKRPWGETERQLEDSIKREVTRSDLPCILLIGEVAYETGLVIPVESLLNRLVHLADRLKVIVDGAHSVGNLAYIRTAKHWDCYVTSTHKWLYSPEPGGLLFFRDAALFDSPPYDAWSASGPPRSTTAVETVTAFMGSAEMLRRGRDSDLWRRSQSLRETFERAAQNLVHVGERTHLETTALTLLVPRDKWRWTEASNLEEFFRRRQIRVTVVRSRHVPVGVRLAFHYFLDGTRTRKLARALSEALSSTSGGDSR